MAKKGKHGLDTGNVIVKWRSKKVRRREAKEKIASLFLDRSTCLSNRLSAIGGIIGTS